MMALKTEDRVGIANRRKEKPLPVCRSGWNNNLKPREMDENTVITARMAGAASRAGGEFVSHHHRDRDSAAAHVMIARRMGGKLIHGEGQEITELKLHDRSHAVDRCTNG